jgi:hypothetical protein
MKAEHRKELQTNLLADRMGRMVQRVKGGPSRRSLLWIALAVLVVIVYLGWTLYRSNQRAIVSTNWLLLGEQYITAPGKTRGTLDLSGWVKESPDTSSALAARMQLVWSAFLWDEGIKAMGANPDIALLRLKAAEKYYEQFGEECKDDPILAPEAAYALAVIEESKTVENRDFLDKALARYRGVASRFRDSAAGKAAQQRVDYIEKNRGSVEEFYAFMNRRLPVRPDMLPMEPPPVAGKQPPVSTKPSPVPSTHPEKK